MGNFRAEDWAAIHWMLHSEGLRQNVLGPIEGCVMGVELEKLFSRDVLEALDERMRRIAIESQPSPAPPEEFISLKTASRRFDIPVDTLEKWVRAGRLKKYKFGRCVRIRPSDLLREAELCG